MDRLRRRPVVPRQGHRRAGVVVVLVASERWREREQRKRVRTRRPARERRVCRAPRRCEDPLEPGIAERA